MGKVVSKDDDPVYKADEAPAPKVTFTEEELKTRLTQQEYDVTQGKGIGNYLLIAAIIITSWSE